MPKRKTESSPNGRVKPPPPDLFLKCETCWLVDEERLQEKRKEDLLQLESSVPLFHLVVAKTSVPSRLKSGDGLLFHSEGFVTSCWVIDGFTTGDVEADLKLIRNRDWGYVRYDLLKNNDREEVVQLDSEELESLLKPHFARALYEYTGDEGFLEYFSKAESPRKTPKALKQTSPKRPSIKVFRGRQLHEIPLQDYEEYEAAVEDFCTESDEIEGEFYELAFDTQIKKLLSLPSNLSEIKRAWMLAPDSDVSTAKGELRRDVNHWILHIDFSGKRKSFVVDPYTNRVMQWSWYERVTQEELQLEALKRGLGRLRPE